MDAAVKMHRLIDGGNILDRLRGGVVQMGIRDQRDGQIAIAGQHVPNRLFLLPVHSISLSYFKFLSAF